MIVKTTEGASRILTQNINFHNALYRAMKDIEIVLDGSYFNGHVEIDRNEDKLIFMNIKPTRHYNGVEDLCDQLNYLIKCNHELDLPLQYNGETFRYRGWTIYQLMSTLADIQDCALDVMKEHGLQGAITDTVIEIDDEIGNYINYYVYINLSTMYGIESLTPVAEDINRLIQSQGISYKDNTSLNIIIEWR